MPEGLRELFPVTVLLEGVETEEIRLRLRKENESRTGMTINVAGDLHLGDNFAADVIGVAGNGSQVRDVSVTHVEMPVDLLALADELVEAIEAAPLQRSKRSGSCGASSQRWRRVQGPSTTALGRELGMGGWY